MPIAVWDYETKPGQGWAYDSQNIDYDEDLDEIQNLSVKYDSLGSASVWAYESK